MKLHQLTAAVVLVLASVSSVSAQSQTEYDEWPRATVIRRFEQSAPKIGEALPDTHVFNSAGESLSLRSLKGSYTVLVLGCLT